MSSEHGTSKTQCIESINTICPTVTIIVPVYNAESCLQRCVDGILVQTFTDFELLLVDDGSKDQTGAICDMYAKQDARVHAIHKVNGGVSSARNKGLEVAKGPFVCFADADDEVAPNWLAAFMENIGELDLCVQGMATRHNNESADRLPKETGVFSMSYLIEILMRSALHGYVFTKCFRMDIIRKHHLQFNESISFREDDVFVTDYAARAGKGICLGESHYVYYLPDANKDYGISATRCVEPLFRSLRLIYGSHYSEQIVQSQSWCVKGAAIERLLDDEPLTEELIEIYREIISSRSKGLKNFILDFLIVNSLRLGKPACLTLKLIHQISK